MCNGVMPQQSKPNSALTKCKLEVERALAYYQANKDSIHDLLRDFTLDPQRTSTRRQRNLVLKHSSSAFELKAKSKAAPSRRRCSLPATAPHPIALDCVAHVQSFRNQQALPSRRGKSIRITTSSIQHRHKRLLDVVPADAWCYALTWLNTARDIICGSSALSKRFTSWLGIHTEMVWYALCQRQSLGPHHLGKLDWSACYRARYEVQTIGLVVEIGSSEVRCGAPSWNTPIGLPIYFDPVQGRFEVTPVTDYTLPPPPLLQQELLLADVAMVEQAVLSAVSAVRRRLGWRRDYQTLPNLLLVVPDLVAQTQLKQRIRQRLVSRGLASKVYVESPAMCIRERYAAEYRLREPVVVVDIGHFRTTVSSSTHVRHQRLAGMAIANLLSHNKRERITIRHDAIVQPLVNSARPALTTRREASQAISKAFSSDMALCADALFRPLSSGSSISALGDSFQAVESLAELVASVTNATCGSSNFSRRAAKSNVVLLGGGGSALVSGLDVLLENELATLPFELGAPVSRRRWRVLKLDRPRHIAWQGAAILLRRHVHDACSEVGDRSLLSRQRQ